MAVLSPLAEPYLGGEELLDAFPQINNGLMATDHDIVNALEAAIYPTAADRIRKIYAYAYSYYGNITEYTDFVMWLKTYSDEIQNFADFANLLEKKDSEICEMFEPWLWPTFSYIKFCYSPYGELDLEGNIEAVIELLNKSIHPSLGTLLLDCDSSRRLPHLIDYLQQAIKDPEKYSWIPTGIGNVFYWDIFVEFFWKEREAIRQLLETESGRWLYKR